MKNMEWYVFFEDSCRQEIGKFNIFEHPSFMNDVKKAYKEHKDNFNAFSEQVKQSLKYYYWSQCEWELVLSDWPKSDKIPEEIIDVYDQVVLNWDIFIKYVWDRCHMRKNAKE